MISLALLLSPKPWTGLRPVQWDRVDTRFCLALASVLAAVLISEMWHGAVIPSTLDSPSRFLLCPRLFLVLRQGLPRTLAWSDLSFAIGALASLGLLLIAPQDLDNNRVTSQFRNAIHYGEITPDSAWFRSFAELVAEGRFGGTNHQDRRIDCRSRRVGANRLARRMDRRASRCGADPVCPRPRRVPSMENALAVCHRDQCRWHLWFFTCGSRPG